MFGQGGLAEEKISEDEKHLADDLKKLCNKKGREEESKLIQSGDVLMRLGELYTKKAVDAQNPMLQKLSFLKSSALLSAARVRFEKKKQEAKKSEVSSLLGKLSESLYDVCGITNHQRNLQDISQALYKRVSEMRGEVKSKLESIPRINSSKNATPATEKQIIAEVSQLYVETTRNYKSLMADISKECILLLGKPPCNFCQVGLGSMARQEITLYSDYEHVIVLDDAVEKMKKSQQKKVKEYFRWFAVCFQVIIIGFGETFVRSVGVKSINDLYSDDPSQNWYFDVYTPCGIAFDGMVPHSCMNPLGRQNQTKNRRHKVEFIQTASKMAQYLSSEEHLKNGYYIKDILARTCLAFGDEDVYRSFEAASTEILQSEQMLDVANDLSSKMSGNVNSYIGAERILLNVDVFDPKRTFYRPITAQIAYLAAFFHIKSSSSFEIIDELERIEALNDAELAHKLRYSVAIICKIRMVAYVQTGHQRSEGELQNVSEAVGNYDSTLIYKCLRYLVVAPALIAQSIGDLPHTAPNCTQVLQNFTQDFMTDATEDINGLLDSCKFEEAILEIEKHLRSPGPSLRLTKLRSFLLHCHFQLGRNNKRNPEKATYHNNKAIDLCELLSDDPDLPPGPKLDLLFILAMAADNKKQKLDACQKFTGIYRMIKFELTDLADINVSTGVAYSSEAVLRQKKEGYLMLLGMQLELSKNMYPPRQLYPEIFSILINEDLYEARFLMCYVMASFTLNTPFSDFTRISYAMFLNELEAHPRELELFVESTTECISAVQNRRHWGSGLDKENDKVSAVLLAQSALLNDVLEVPDKVEKCLEICKRHLKDEDFVFTYAYALAVYAFRMLALEDNVEEVHRMKSQAPKPVKKMLLFQITMKKFDDIATDPGVVKPGRRPGFKYVPLSKAAK